MSLIKACHKAVRLAQDITSAHIGGGVCKDPKQFGETLASGDLMHIRHVYFEESQGISIVVQVQGYPE